MCMYMHLRSGAQFAGRSNLSRAVFGREVMEGAGPESAGRGPHFTDLNAPHAKMKHWRWDFEARTSRLGLIYSA